MRDWKIGGTPMMTVDLATLARIERKLDAGLIYFEPGTQLDGADLKARIEIEHLIRAKGWSAP